MSFARLNRIVPVAGILASLCIGLILMAGAARADAAEEPFKVEFDTSTLQVSVIENLPLDALSTKATIEGTIDENGALTIPAGGFKMPELGITEPVAVKGFMGIEGPATGTFDKATGQMTINGKAGIWVSVNVKQLLDTIGGLGVDLSGSLGDIGPYVGLLGNLTCGFSPMDIQFSTEPNSLTSGKRFTEGLTGPGALAAEWSQLGPFAGRTKIFGLIDACALIKDQLPALLGGLGGGTGTGGIDLGGLLEGLDLTQLDNLNLGPSAITITKTKADPVDPPIVEPPIGDPTPAKLKLSVTPRNRKAKAGASVRYRATVRNTGGSTSKPVKVCVATPKKAIRSVRRCKTLGNIKPGASKRGNFRVKLKKQASKRGYKIKFRIRSGATSKPKLTAGLRIR